MPRHHRAAHLALLAAFAPLPAAADVTLDAVQVRAAAELPLADTVTPTSVIDAETAEHINTSSVEDIVKYEPSLVVRRRYIGDSNGTLGMRGANMFQTARSSVYADGLALHSTLETRWSGAPRWGLVSPEEVEATEVLYGPFSAEYGGNAMGGVVRMHTRMPAERKLAVEAGAFAQDFEFLGADDTYTGHRESLYWADAFGDWRISLLHHRLENDGQPQTFRARETSAPTGGETAVRGAFLGPDATGTEVAWVGDTGTAATRSDLTKLRLGYALGDWLARATVAYEDRDWFTRPTNYLVDASGNPVWEGDAVFGGRGFDLKPKDFAISDQTRRSLLAGFGVEGPLGADWTLEADLSRFEVLDDATRSSNRNPDDPAFTPAGTLSAYDDTGWRTFDLKARTEHLAGRNDMRLVAGYHYERNSLRIDGWNSDDFAAGEKTARSTSSGGKTRIHALFAQWGWDFAPRWDVSLGARHERWETYDAFFHTFGGELLDFDDRDATGFSPKFSLGFAPAEHWQLRYSLARAYRFPIVEELYSNEQSIHGETIADATLEPEIGVHHNLMIERAIPRGVLRANLFFERVRDTIWSQTDVVNNVRTFLPVDRVRTRGVELIVEQQRVAGAPVDLRANLTWTDSRILENSADPATEGRVFPRMPRWRANLLAIWHAGDRLDTSLGLRYASDSYGNLDNSDTVDRVYGAQDEYLFVDLKAGYRIGSVGKVSVGVDNLFDTEAFVAHPWPQRTFFVEGKLSF